MLNSCLQTQTASLMKLKQIIFMKIFMKIKICLILVIIHKIQSFLILPTKAIGRMKDEFRGKIISEFIGLKQKMYSLIVADNGEIKAKGVNKNTIKNMRHKE